MNFQSELLLRTNESHISFEYVLISLPLQKKKKFHSSSPLTRILSYYVPTGSKKNLIIRWVQWNLTRTFFMISQSEHLQISFQYVLISLPNPKKSFITLPFSPGFSVIMYPPHPPKKQFHSPSPLPRIFSKFVCTRSKMLGSPDGYNNGILLAH